MINTKNKYYKMTDSKRNELMRRSELRRWELADHRTRSIFM